MTFAGFDIEVSGLTLSPEEISVLRHLHELSLTTGFEYGQAQNTLGFTDEFTSSNCNHVNIPDWVYDGKPIRLYHSHTNETLFSRQDYVLLLTGQVERISVVAITGEIFSAYNISGDIPPIDEYWETVANIVQEVDLQMIEDPRLFDLDFRSREIVTYREQSYQIARHYKWILEGGTP